MSAGMEASWKDACDLDASSQRRRPFVCLEPRKQLSTFSPRFAWKAQNLEATLNPGGGFLKNIMVRTDATVGC